MRRVGGRVVPEYTLHLGGGVDGAGATFGRQALKVPARRVPEALIRLLTLFQRERREGEPVLAFFRRVDEDTVREVVADLSKIDEATATPEDFLDLGDAHEFEVKTGPGECAV
jgi:sulfite reductase (NADPH) hemoprotein beta-component